MFAQLGTVRFEGLKSFETFSATRAAIYAEHARVVGKPSLQRVGDALETISVGIRLSTAFCVPEDEVRSLETYRADGEVLPLLLGTGEYVGDYVITDIQRDILETDKNGGIVLISLSINLLEFYDEDKIKTQKANAIDNAYAVQDGTIKPVRVIPQLPISTAGSISADLEKVNISSRIINSSVTNAVNSPSRSDYYYDQITKGLTNTQDALSSVTSKINNAEDILDLVPNLPDSIMTAQNIISTFQSSMPPSSPSDLRSVNSLFQSAVYRVGIDSARINSLTAIRR